MKAIHLPDDQFALISQQAVAAGYSEVGAYVQALAEKAAFDPRMGMTETDLRRTAAECASLHDTMRAGHERDARQAMGELGSEFGFGAPE